MKRYFAAFALAVSLASPAALFAADPLEGTTWEMKELGQLLQKRDTLTFQDGQVTSSKYSTSFEPADYDSTPSGDDGAAWTAVQKNDRGQSLNWQGVWDGEGEMSGSYTYNDGTGTVTTKQFSAERTR